MGIIVWITNLKTLAEFLLLLVDYAQAEINFVGLFELRGHAHHLRESLLGVIK